MPKLQLAIQTYVKTSSHNNKFKQTLLMMKDRLYKVVVHAADSPL